MRRRIRSLLAVLVPCAMAQTPEADRQREYYRQQDQQREEQQRRAQEEFQRQQKATEEQKKRQGEYDVQSRSDAAKREAEQAPARRARMAQDTQNAADMKALRAKLLGMPPLPDERNPLLGQWRVESVAKPQRKDELGLLMGMLANPGGAACQFTFGGGITEFKPKSWASIDGHGDDSLGPIAYRGDAKRVWAIPAKGIELMGFDVADRNRAVSVNLEGCTLVRVGAPAANAAANAATAPGNARTGAANSSVPPAAGALPQVAAAAPSPPRSTLARPSPEVCRNTLIDKLGTVGTNQVRAMSDVRFKEMAIEGKVPNTNNLRIDLRGSACDDPRVKATLYDFDANEMLQSITYVWERPPGPAPAPIFNERITQLSRFHSLPPPQTPGRLQADTSLGRLILQDMPERNLLLEAYAAKK